MFLFLVLALPIFPVRLQTSIVGRSELNFRVRNGNGWTLALISTNCCRSVCLGNLISGRTLKTEQRRIVVSKAHCLQIVGQALGLLVPVSSIHYCTSTSGLSNKSSICALTP